ncbi:protoheme IX farnesyltransferase [Russula earlei]|uniref:Protoheme IX farnesyltransferase n=1 Tax=Russula earlei TaxID=71964 RepID=A0ACC0U5F4_9AGAM|nr:protoheme IX farnesyltransferase [Russula earlei]
MRPGLLPNASRFSSLRHRYLLLHRSAPILTRHDSTLSSKPLDFFFHNGHKETQGSEPWPLHRTGVPPLAPCYRAVPNLTPTRLLGIYAQLSKARLSAFNVLVAIASANALNELQEVPYDAQMARTRGRPLVRRAVSPAHAAAFAATTGLAGPALLWTMCNPTTALLGAANILLYAGPYTRMKRRTVWNTWVGAIVGAVPPLMGWAAGGGALLPSAAHPLALHLPPPLLASASASAAAMTDNPLAPWALFAVLFSWQFPHFNALAHFVRSAYAQGGYRMLAVLDARRNRLVALRHVFLLTGICSTLVPLCGLTTWSFALTSLVPNAIWLRAAWRFNRFGGDAHARTVFMHSLWYLPIVLGLMIVHKNNVDWLQTIGITAATEEETEKTAQEQA